MHRSKVELRSLIAAGVCVLDISKTVLYEMFYDVIRKAYGKQAICQYVDTDSIMFNLVQDLTLRNSDGTIALMPCFYKFMVDHPEFFEFSNFKTGHRLNAPGQESNYLNCWKDELGGACITYAIALASKSYAIEYEQEETGEKHNKIKLKGISKRVSKQFTPDDFRQVFDNRETRMSTMSRIMRKNHQLYTVEYNKLSLNFANPKRIFLPDDSSRNYAPGHYKTLLA